MSKQVLDIEQMLYIKELGVDTSKADLCWKRNIKEVTGCNLSLSFNMKNEFRNYERFEYIPTFTLQDIFYLLPKQIKTTNYTFHLHINYERNHIAYAYTDGNGYTWLNQSFRINNNLLEAAYKMLCWCAENGYLK